MSRVLLSAVDPRTSLDHPGAYWEFQFINAIKRIKEQKYASEVNLISAHSGITSQLGIS